MAALNYGRKIVKLQPSSQISLASFSLGLLLQFYGYVEFPKIDETWFGPSATDLQIAINNWQEKARFAGVMSRLGLIAFAVAIAAITVTAFNRVTSKKSVNVNVVGNGHTVVLNSDGNSQVVVNSPNAEQVVVPSQQDLHKLVSDLQREMQTVNFTGSKNLLRLVEGLSKDLKDGKTPKNAASTVQKVLETAQSAGIAGKSIVDLAAALKGFF